MADPELELAFSCAGDRLGPGKALPAPAGQRFFAAGFREAGASAGRGPQQETRWPQLIWYGSCWPAPSRGAEAAQGNVGHLWVVAGILQRPTLSACPVPATDHDRLVERLRPVADLEGCNRPLTLASARTTSRGAGVEVFTAGGSNRTPQVAQGISLQRAAAAAAAARNDLKDIEDSLASSRQGFQQAFDQACRHQVRMALSLPRCKRRAPGP